MGCMSPLYATPPISPGSDNEGNFDDQFGQPSTIFTTQNVESNDHFARDTHMRIILGNSKETTQPTKYVTNYPFQYILINVSIINIMDDLEC